MLASNFPDYGTKEYYERELAKQKLTVDIMTAGLADMFAKQDRYTVFELGDMAKLYYDVVVDFESAQQKFDERFTTVEDDE